MKNYLLCLLMAFIVTGVMSQVPRTMVVLEIGTGLGCTYCPGASRAADSLIATGKSVAVIEYHYADSLTNDASMNRIFYYSYEGIPVGHFDGVLHHLGGEGCPNGNIYSTYLPLYEQRIVQTSSVLIGIAGASAGNNIWNLTLSFHKIGPVASTDLKLHLAVTENHVPSPPWPGAGGCMTENHYLMRCMLPDHQGTPVSFATGDMQIVNLTLTKPTYWNTNQIELVAFLQDNASKEILNGSKVMLTALPLPMTVDFSASQTSGCAPYSSSFTPVCPGADTYQWTFPGGSPATSTLPNPSVTYAASGTFDVGLIAWNSATGVGNYMTKPGFVSATAVPGVPGTPMGSAGLCINPPDQGYVTSGSSGAETYTWNFSPAEAGILTPLGNSCMINFTDTWIGTASLKVRGENTCGAGNWSLPLPITVEEAPGIPATPSGPQQVYTGATPTTSYSTTGAFFASGYAWSLEPATAGIPSGAGLQTVVTWNPAFHGMANLKVAGENSCGQGSFSDSLMIQVDLGVGYRTQTNRNAFLIYPNPAGDYLYIENLSVGIYTVNVLDMIGNQVLNKKITATETRFRIETSPWRPGVYFIQITGNGETWTRIITIFRD